MHEVRLVLEKGGWRIYKDGCLITGIWFEPKDMPFAKSEARELAKKLSPCRLKVIDYSGFEIISELL